MQKYLGHTFDSVSKPGIDAVILKTLGITCKNVDCIQSNRNLTNFKSGHNTSKQ